MNRVLYLICIGVLGVGGFVFYVTQNLSRVLEVPPTSTASTILTQDIPVTQTMETTSDVPTSTKNVTDKKAEDCSCCSSIEKRKRLIASTKQKRKALELWARKMIAIHGYEEGIKHVNAKSSVLAKRIELPEKEENNTISETSQNIP